MNHEDTKRRASNRPDVQGQLFEFFKDNCELAKDPLSVRALFVSFVTSWFNFLSPENFAQD